MPAITLRENEVEPGVLPPVCMVCGGPGGVRRSVGFSWVPPMSHLLLLASPFVWLAAYFFLRRTMTVEVPACGRHQWHWLCRKLLGLVGVLGLLMVGGLVVFMMGAPVAPWLPPWWAVGVAFLLILVLATWLRLTGVRVDEITPQSITLDGVAPAFAEALKAGRADYARRMREWRERQDRKAGGGG